MAQQCTSQHQSKDVQCVGYVQKDLLIHVPSKAWTSNINLATSMFSEPWSQCICVGRPKVFTALLNNLRTVPPLLLVLHWRNTTTLEKPSMAYLHPISLWWPSRCPLWSETGQGVSSAPVDRGLWRLRSLSTVAWRIPSCLLDLPSRLSVKVTGNPMWTWERV